MTRNGVHTMSVSPTVFSLIRAIAGHIPQEDAATLVRQAQEAAVVDEDRSNPSPRCSTST
ncbi:hypothetical protein GCM10010413_32550 [Promicromonospora sukumoe]